MKKLTARQTAVLATVERLGEPTIPDLKGQFPPLYPSEIWRVLCSLERRGLVAFSGNPYWRYLGDLMPPDFSIPSDEVYRVRSTYGSANERECA